MTYEAIDGRDGSIDGDGDMVALDQDAVGARIYATSSQSLPSATRTQIAFDTEEHQDTGAVTADTANNKLILERPGWYSITGIVQIITFTANSRAVTIIEVAATDEVASNFQSSINDNIGATVAVDVYLAPGDEPEDVTLDIFHDSGNSEDTSSGKNATSLSAIWMG